MTITKVTAVVEKRRTELYRPVEVCKQVTSGALPPSPTRDMPRAHCVCGRRVDFALQHPDELVGRDHAGYLRQVQLGGWAVALIVPGNGRRLTRPAGRGRVVVSVSPRPDHSRRGQIAR